MRLAIIENNIVTNIVESSIEFANSQGWNYVQLDDNEPCGFNYTYNGETFIAPVIETLMKPEEPTDV